MTLDKERLDALRRSVEADRQRQADARKLLIERLLALPQKKTRSPVATQPAEVLDPSTLSSLSDDDLAALHKLVPASAPRWLLTVDPGKNGCGCTLWHDAKLVAAAYVAPTVGRDIEALGRSALSSACEATAGAVAGWWRNYAYEPLYAPRDLKLICELPRTYGGRAKKGDANSNVVPLSVVVGMIAGALGCPTALVWPQDWKGTIPKPERQSEPYIVQERVKAHLTAEEAARVEWPRNKKLQWDVADAIGIGMARLGRAFKKV